MKISPVVLVIEDDAAVRDSLKFSLELEGYAVRLYKDAESLLSEEDLPPCGCLLVDQHIPGRSGLDLLAELRERKIGWPAILMTGHPSPALRLNARRAGMPMLDKPLLGDSLTEAIRNAFCGIDQGQLDHT